jgi:hypothetical protein
MQKGETMLDEWTFNGHTFALIDARDVRGTWLVLMDTEVLMERSTYKPTRIDVHSVAFGLPID